MARTFEAKQPVCFSAPPPQNATATMYWANSDRADRLTTFNTLSLTERCACVCAQTHFLRTCVCVCSRPPRLHGALVSPSTVVVRLSWRSQESTETRPCHGCYSSFDECRIHEKHSRYFTLASSISRRMCSRKFIPLQLNIGLTLYTIFSTIISVSIVARIFPLGTARNTFRQSKAQRASLSFVRTVDAFSDANDIHYFVEYLVFPIVRWEICRIDCIVGKPVIRSIFEIYTLLGRCLSFIIVSHLG